MDRIEEIRERASRGYSETDRWCESDLHHEAVTSDIPYLLERVSELERENERLKGQMRQIDDAVEGMGYEMNDGITLPTAARERLQKILGHVRW